MDEKEFKECLKIHGYESGEEEIDSGSKIKLGELYETFKPPPILIDTKIHKIIEIGTSGVCQLVSSNASKLTKKQTKRRRKKHCQNNTNNDKIQTDESKTEVVKSEYNAQTSRKKKSRRRMKQESDKSEDVEKKMQKSNGDIDGGVRTGSKPFVVDSESREKCEYNDTTFRSKIYRKKEKQKIVSAEEIEKKMQKSSGIFTRSGVVFFEEKHSVGLAIISCLVQNVEVMNNLKRNNKVTVKKQIIQ